MLINAEQYIAEQKKVKLFLLLLLTHNVRKLTA